MNYESEVPSDTEKSNYVVEKLFRCQTIFASAAATRSASCPRKFSPTAVPRNLSPTELKHQIKNGCISC